MPVKYDTILGKLREDTDGLTGELRDSTNTVIADVSRGLITAVYFTGVANDLLLQNGTDVLLLQTGGTDNLLTQGA